MYGKDWRDGKTKDELEERSRKLRDSKYKPILQYTKDGIFIKE